MSKQTEKLKKQLIEFSEIVNLFKSEAVQVKVINMLFDSVADDTDDPNFKKKQKNDHRNFEHVGRKKPGATKVLNQLLTSTDFFDTHRSISSIADYCKINYNSDFKTSELSGILLKLANEHKLKRERSEANKRFEYVRV